MAKQTKRAQGLSRTEWQDNARDKIQANGILNRVINHVVSEEGTLSVSQVNAARILLNKTIPDLKAMELTGLVDLQHGGKVELLINGKSSTD